MKNYIVSSSVLKSKVQTKALTVVIHTVVTMVFLAVMAVGCTVTGIPEDTSISPQTSFPVETTVPVETTEVTEPLPQIPDDAYPAGTYVIDSAADSPPPGIYVFLPYTPGEKAHIDIRHDGTIFAMDDFQRNFFWNLQKGNTVSVTNGYFRLADGYSAEVNEDGSCEPGMYRIGSDILAGKYLLVPEGSSGGDWKTYSSITSSVNPFRQSTSETIILDLTEATAIKLFSGTLQPFNPVLFPEPPEVAADVQPLPEDCSSSTLVSTYWDNCIVFPDTTYYISIPAIYPFSQEAIDLQQEIYRIFEADLRAELETRVDTYKDDYEFSIDRPEENIMNFPRDGSEYHFGYLAGYRNGVLSITIRRNLPDAGNHAFEVYNFDIATGKQIGTLEALELIGFGLERAVREVEDLYQWTQKSDTPPDDYQRLLKKTLSEENFTNSNLIIYDDSYLSIIIDIFTIHRTEPLRWGIGLGFLPS